MSKKLGSFLRKKTWGQKRHRRGNRGSKGGSCSPNKVIGGASNTSGSPNFSVGLLFFKYCGRHHIHRSDTVIVASLVTVAWVFILAQVHLLCSLGTHRANLQFSPWVLDEFFCFENTRKNCCFWKITTCYTRSNSLTHLCELSMNFNTTPHFDIFCIFV